MPRTLLATAMIALFSTAAAAGPLSMAKRETVQPHRKANYTVSANLVSANLNKLVFWSVPSRDGLDAPKH